MTGLYHRLYISDLFFIIFRKHIVIVITVKLSVFKKKHDIISDRS